MKSIFIPVVLTLGVLTTAGCSGGSVSIQLGEKEATATSSPEAQSKSPEQSGQATPVQQSPKPVSKVPAPRPAPVAVAPQGNGSNPSRYFVQTRDGGPLNVRVSNNTQSAVVGSLPNQTSVIVTHSDRDGAWFEISAPGGIKGWASAQFLIEEVGANHSPASSHSAATLRVQTLDGDPVNIRTEPTLEGNVIGSASHGSYVTYHNTVGQWTEITTPTGVSGYIVSQYLVSN